jgi:hypothetical protein
LLGPDREKENRPDYILNSLQMNFQCEIDVRFVNNKWFLGHDDPQYEIPFEFLNTEALWIHCKNINALTELLKYPQLNFFWHQEDDYTLTSLGFIWCYPGKEVYFQNKAICVMPEQYNTNFRNFDGVCSDFIGNINDKINNI